MCLSTPSVPKPPPPPQELKPPEPMKRKKGPIAPGTLLTGPSGVSAGSLNTGGTTLLGG